MRVDELRKCFEDSAVLFVTNDSHDDTSKTLHEWSATVSDASIISLDGLSYAIKSRTDRLAMARNLCLLEFRRSLERGRKYGLLVILDLDGVNAGVVTGSAFTDAIQAAPDDWGGLFGNQRQAYYDIWALRHQKWCPNDCWQEVARAMRYIPRGMRTFAQRKLIKQYVFDRQVLISAREAPISVDSAFGGIGIYKTKLLSGKWYSGRDGDGREVCEHVGFNLQLRSAGAKLYILPSLLNDTPSEHIGPGTGSRNRPWV
jgi:hypothetical protein